MKKKKNQCLLQLSSHKPSINFSCRRDDVLIRFCPRHVTLIKCLFKLGKQENGLFSFLVPQQEMSIFLHHFKE